MTTDGTLNAPWSTHFERDGTEDMAVIRDSNGEELLRSRHFWLPEGDDPIPPTLAAMRLIRIAPALLGFARRVAAASGAMRVPAEFYEAAAGLTASAEWTSPAPGPIEPDEM